MHAALRSHFTTGVAIAGAGAIALAPVVVPPPALSPLERAVAQSVMRDTSLLATTVDLGGTFNASLEGFLGGLATALNLDVTLDANGGVSLADFMAALSAGITGGLDGGPVTTLLDLMIAPIELITTTVGALVGGLMPGGIVDTLAQVVAAPVRFGLEALMTGNDALTGLVTGGIDLFSGLLTTGLDTTAGFLAGAVETGSTLLGNLFIGASTLVTTGAASLVGLLAPLAALPIIGPAVVAFGDVMGGFVNAGATVLDGIGTGVEDGGAVLAGLITDPVSALTNAITGGTGVLTGAIDTGSTALNDVLQGFLDAVNAIVPPPETAQAPASAATTMLAAVRAGESATGAASLRGAPAASTVTLPTEANAKADAATSGSVTVTLPPHASANAAAATSGSATVEVPDTASTTAKDVRGEINSRANAGVDLGKAISGVASGKTRVSGGGSTDGGSTSGSAGGSTAASVGGSASGSASASGKSASSARGANGAAHADGHAKVKADR